MFLSLWILRRLFIIDLNCNWGRSRRWIWFVPIRFIDFRRARALTGLFLYGLEAKPLFGNLARWKGYFRAAHFFDLAFRLNGSRPGGYELARIVIVVKQFLFYHG